MKAWVVLCLLNAAQWVSSSPRPTLLQHRQQCPMCACGISMHWTRIVGGAATEIHEFPWMVALAMNGKFFCGGTLINDRYVLTAAHCVMDLQRNKQMRVILLEHNQAIMDETMVESRPVDTVIRHPGFRPTVSLDNDLALVRLKQQVLFKTGLAPACLPPPDDEFVSRVGIVAGWGAVMENGSSSSVLQAVHVPILTHAQCLMTDYMMSRLTKNMLCAGKTDGGVDSCQGDSGGPLLIEDTMMRMVAAGVVSWGQGCARPRLPGIYTRVNRYLTWIQGNTRDACPCS